MFPAVYYNVHQVTLNQEKSPSNKRMDILGIITAVDTHGCVITYKVLYLYAMKALYNYEY